MEVQIKLQKEYKNAWKFNSYWETFSGIGKYQKREKYD
jgi:hypothetical protein